MEENMVKQAEKPSYEELEGFCKRLSDQAMMLQRKLQEANLFNTYKRMDYLFKVVEYNECFNTEFVNNCINELEDLITIKEEPLAPNGVGVTADA
jgi:hypothetical protein